VILLVQGSREPPREAAARPAGGTGVHAVATPTVAPSDYGKDLSGRSEIVSSDATQVGVADRPMQTAEFREGKC